MREIILDTETTGLDPLSGHRVIEIGAIEVFHKIRTGRFFHAYLNPERDVPEEAFRIHGISSEFLKDKKKFAEVADDFLEFIAGDTLVIHNAKFDIKFLNYELRKAAKEEILYSRVICTLDMARRKFPGSPANLNALCKRFDIDLSAREKHGALLDSELLAEVYLWLCGGNQPQMLEQKQEEDSSLENKLYDVIRKSRSKRAFEVDEEDLKNHLELMKKINADS